MRNGWMGFAGALVCASTLAVVACGSDSSDGTADEPSGSGGSAGSGSVAAGTAPAGSCTMNAGGTAVTNLCGAAPLNTLTQTEATQLCSDTSAYVASSIGRATGCKYIGIVAAASSSSPTEAQLRAACSGREGNCTLDGTILGPGGDTLCGQIPPTCSATVEQYSTCVKDEAVIFDQGASALVSCSLLTFANLSTAYTVPTAASDAPSCKAIKMACPNFTIPYIN